MEGRHALRAKQLCAWVCPFTAPRTCLSDRAERTRAACEQQLSITLVCLFAGDQEDWHRAVALPPAVHAEAERAAAAEGAQPRGSGGWPLLAQDFEAHLIACPAPCSSLQLHALLFCAAPSVGLRCWLGSHALAPSPYLPPSNSPLACPPLALPTSAGGD